ncbi:MAG TPA: S41 family peptidase [Bacteroidia bacterium]|jgi:hypothetical protein
MKKTTMLFFLLLIFSFIACGDSVEKKYIDQVFAIVEGNSLKRDSLDFIKIKEEAYLSAESAQSLDDCHAIVKTILLRLNDKHSFFWNKQEVKAAFAENIHIEGEELITFEGALIANDIGLLKIKGFNILDRPLSVEYTDSLQRLIKSIDYKDLKGWIIDLRENEGGNPFPMLAGIGPLVGNGIFGFMMNNKGYKYSCSYQNGIVKVDTFSYRMCAIPYTLINEAAPVALLIGPKTKSAGEMIAIVFIGKSNSKSFGRSTYGLTTGNEFFMLTDSAGIWLTTMVDVGRDGHVYGGKLNPDVLVDSCTNIIFLEKDRVKDAAINWIENY